MRDLLVFICWESHIYVMADVIETRWLKMQGMKMTDQVWGRENAGHESARHDKYRAMHENDERPSDCR